MTSPHLSEPALQVAAEAATPLSAAQVAHLGGCPQCQGQVAAYGQLFAAVAQLPPPVFDFDLGARVLVQLTTAHPSPVRQAFPWALGLVLGLVLGVVAAFVVVLGSALGPALSGLASGLGLGLGVVAGALVAGQCLELLARHRRQLRQLAFS
jgi:anti-sigma factor RsiW